MSTGKCKRVESLSHGRDAGAKCIFCQSSDDREEKYGRKLSKGKVTVHYFCMLFASGLYQNGRSDEDGILGFLPRDIEKESRRAGRLKCSYCKQFGATIGCVRKECRAKFHFGCGYDSNVLNQFYGKFSSFCEEHRPTQSVPKSNRLSFKGSSRTQCIICMNHVEARASFTTLRAPCCKNKWYHKACIQRMATYSGVHFFKCPLCNNKDVFQKEMLTYGIYIPDQDAAWEQEPNAFADLLERYTHCDVEECLCLDGRSCNMRDTRWEIVRCDICGSQGCHIACASLCGPGDDWVCTDCTAIDKRLSDNPTSPLPGPSRSQNDKQKSSLLVRSSEKKTHSGMGNQEKTISLGVGKNSTIEKSRQAQIMSIEKQRDKGKQVKRSQDSQQNDGSVSRVRKCKNKQKRYSVRLAQFKKSTSQDKIKKAKTKATCNKEGFSPKTFQSQLRLSLKKSSGKIPHRSLAAFSASKLGPAGVGRKQSPKKSSQGRKRLQFNSPGSSRRETKRPRLNSVHVTSEVLSQISEITVKENASLEDVVKQQSEARTERAANRYSHSDLKPLDLYNLPEWTRLLLKDDIHTGNNLGSRWAEIQKHIGSLVKETTDAEKKAEQLAADRASRAEQRHKHRVEIDSQTIAAHPLWMQRILNKDIFTGDDRGSKFADQRATVINVVDNKSVPKTNVSEGDDNAVDLEPEDLHIMDVHDVFGRLESVVFSLQSNKSSNVEAVSRTGGTGNTLQNGVDSDDEHVGTLTDKSPEKQLLRSCKSPTSAQSCESSLASVLPTTTSPTELCQSPSRVGTGAGSPPPGSRGRGRQASHCVRTGAGPPPPGSRGRGRQASHCVRTGAGLPPPGSRGRGRQASHCVRTGAGSPPPGSRGRGRQASHCVRTGAGSPPPGSRGRGRQASHCVRTGAGSPPPGSDGRGRQASHCVRTGAGPPPPGSDGRGRQACYSSYCVESCTPTTTSPACITDQASGACLMESS